jgi:hypothetical protein
MDQEIGIYSIALAEGVTVASLKQVGNTVIA